jgi:hypothetical protein
MKCRRSWDNGKARCGQKVAGVGDSDKESSTLVAGEIMESEEK